MTYCIKHGVACELANINGYCTVTGCMKMIFTSKGEYKVVGSTGKVDVINYVGAVPADFRIDAQKNCRK